MAAPSLPPGTSTASAAAGTGRDGGADTFSGQDPVHFLGFERGEERRYVLGPPEELRLGEEATWSMTLREVLGDPPEAVFELSYAWDRGKPSLLGIAVGTVTRVQSSGELRVNSHGFPIEARFETERHLAGMGSERYSVRYRFEDGTYVKHMDAGGKDLDHRVLHLRNDGVDLDVPSGIFPFGSAAFECLRMLPPYAESMPEVATPPVVTAGGGGAPVPPVANPRFAAYVSCKEPLFANPGLLSLMLPTLWEAATGELEFVVLTPAGYFGMPSIGGGGGFRGVSGAMNDGEFDFRTASHPRTNSDIEQLRYRDRVRVEVGPRTVDAWLFDGMHDFDAVYVDDAGAVVRVDLASYATIEIPGSGAMEDVDPGLAPDTRKLWVRLLFPSEY